MHSASLFALFLVVVGSSADPSIGILSKGCNAGMGGLGLPSINTQVQTGVVENPANFIPSYIPPTSISHSCHNLKTIVRPQIRNEMISVPTVDRLVRYVSSPVVDVITENCPGNIRHVDYPTITSGAVFPATVPAAFSGISALPYQGSFGMNGIVENIGCGSNIVV